MHKALLIPEIVAHIIDCNRSDPGYLYDCVLINTLFFHSTIPFLWSECGGLPTIRSCATPRVQDLIEIARKDAQRGQLYADCIKQLQITRITAFKNRDGNFFRGKNKTKHIYKELAQLGLEWRNVEDLNIFVEEHWDKEYEAVFMPLLQPRLKKITVYHGEETADAVLQMLEDRCLGLKKLALKADDVKNLVSEEAIMRFMEKFRLESLDIRDNGERSRGGEMGDEHGRMLQLFSQQTSLKEISIPDVQPAFLELLATRHNDLIFPTLESLSTGLSSQALTPLRRIFPQISSFSLDIRDLVSIFPDIFAFSQLSKLSIKGFPGLHIFSTDLIQLVQSCTSLSHLSICESQPIGDRVRMEDLSNSTIEAIARNSRNLKELCILVYVPRVYLSDEMYPTELALESLGQYCTKLERLRLTCDPSWHALNKNPQNVLFPKVWDLQITGPENRYELGWVLEVGLQQMAAGFVARCPKLLEFRFLEPYGEDPFDSWVRKAIRKRR